MLKGTPVYFFRRDDTGKLMVRCGRLRRLRDGVAFIEHAGKLHERAEDFIYMELKEALDRAREYND